MKRGRGSEGGAAGISAVSIETGGLVIVAGLGKGWDRKEEWWTYVIGLLVMMGSRNRVVRD